MGERRQLRSLAQATMQRSADGAALSPLLQRTSREHLFKNEDNVD